MFKHFVGFIGVFFGWAIVCGLPAVACTPGGMLECSENHYNASCNAGMLSQPGYECKSCNGVSKDGVNFPKSDGGKVTIDACYRKFTCSNLNPSQDWACTLFYNGKNICTESHTSDTPVEVHAEKINGTLGCVSNEKSCSEFDIVGDTALFWADGNFSKSNQTGVAEWDTENYTWDVTDCLLSRDSLNIKYNRDCTGTVHKSAATISGSATLGYKIDYNGIELYYCTACDEGKSPQIVGLVEAFDNFSCYKNTLNNTYYLACKCVDVSKPYYSVGCNIEYPLWNNDVPDECQRTCENNNMETITDGASSDGDCRPKTSVTYTDKTGTFTLGTGPC